MRQQEFRQLRALDLIQNNGVQSDLQEDDWHKYSLAALFRHAPFQENLLEQLEVNESFLRAFQDLHEE